MIPTKLSLYRTEHTFHQYREIGSATGALSAVRESDKSHSRIYILGNGSNTFFTRKHVRSVVLKNKLPREIKKVSEETYYVSSSNLVSEVLKYCHNHQLQSFYYLASVPAEIGGAIAMNAGEGPALRDSCIFNFIEKVRYIRDGKIIEESPDRLSVSYRKTIFTGSTNLFILGAYFRFPPSPPFEENPIRQRIEWAKSYQDNTKPNCGSVFKTANPKILDRFRGLRLFGASFSTKTYNWILNESKSPLGIKLLIALVMLAHRLLIQKCETEVIRVK